MSSEIEERNTRAVMEALKHQNSKLDGYHNKIVSLEMQVQALNREIIELKKKNMEDLVSQFSSGPTVT